MNNTIKRTWNQGSMVNIEDLRGMTFQAESGGHTFVISAVDADGNAVALSGTPAGTMLRPDNTDQALTCSISGGKVYATLPAGCYDVPGRAGITIFLTSGGQKAAIYAAVVSITRTQSGTAAPGTTQSVVDLINAINTAIAGIPATDTAIKAAMAPTYSNSGLYAVGDYAWYNGTLYRCTTAITTAETWTSGHWTAAAIGTDSATGLRDLKSALDYVQNGHEAYLGTLIPNEYPDSTGFPSQPGWMRTDYIEVVPGDTVIFNNPTRASSDNVWYDENKAYLSKFTVSIGTKVEVVVRSGAKYMVASNAAADFYTGIYLNNPVLEAIDERIISNANNIGKTKDSLVELQSGKFGYIGETIPNEIPNTSGGFDPQSNWLRTNYIEVFGGDTIIFNNPTRASSDNVWYTENKGYISKFTVGIGSAVEIEVPSNAKYFVASNDSRAFYAAIVCESIPYFRNESERITKDIYAVGDKVTENKTAIEYQRNGYDYYIGGYIKNEVPNTSGGFDPQNNWLRTDYIEVTGGEKVYFNNPTRASSDNVWYNENKEYVARSTVNIGNGTYIIAPSTAKYLIASNAAQAFYSAIYLENEMIGEIIASAESTETANENDGEKLLFLSKNDFSGKYWEMFGYESFASSGTNKYMDGSRTIFGKKSVYSDIDNTNILDVRLLSGSNSINLEGISVVELIVYIDDATKIEQITLQFLNTNYSRSITTGIINGWNRLKFYTFDGDTSTWNTSTGVRTIFYGESGRAVWVDSVRFLRRPTALMFFVEDGGYTTFYEVAQPAFDALGAPVTWAIDPKALEDGHYNMSMEDMQEVMKNGNAEFSFHSYAGERTAIMTKAELIDDTENSLRWLSKNGLLPKYYWRAAFTQNDAPEYMAIADIIPVLATHNSRVGIDSFPFSDPLNVPRTGLHNRSTDDIDEYFDKLQKTHSFICLYTHGIDDTAETNTSIAKWEHFLSILTTAINNGWMKVTTYNRLMMSHDY